MGDLKKFDFTSDDDAITGKLDLLPYGTILVDETGKILFYNRQEELAAGIKRDEVLGKNFFTDVAPCAQIGEFYDRFKAAIKETGVLATFHFKYTVQPQPREVEIVMASFRYAGQLLCLIIAGDIT